MDSGALPLVRARVRPATVAESIQELLKGFRGLHSLKKLFWELLGYDRRDEAILLLHSASFRHSVIEGRLFASHDSFHLYSVTLLGSPSDRPLVQRICRSLRRKHRDFAVLASDATQTRWQLAYLTDGSGTKRGRVQLTTMAIGDPEENLHRQARLLSRLKTYDCDDAPLGVLEVASAFEGVFAGIRAARSGGSKVHDDLYFLIQILNRYPVLTSRQERSLFSELAELETRGVGPESLEHGRRERYQRLREELVLHNLRLCFMLARRFANGYQEIPDLFQVGVIGLLRAVEGFDPEEGTRFSTYASYWIKQSIRRAVMNKGKPIRLPAYMVSLLSKWRRASAILTDRLRRAPTPDEVGNALRLTKKKISMVAKAIRVHNLMPHSDSNANEGTLLDDVLIDDRNKDPEKQMIQDDDLDRILGRLDELEDREATVIRMRFGLEPYHPMTLREVGENLGLTRERVRQIEQHALEDLRRLPEFVASEAI